MAFLAVILFSAACAPKEKPPEYDPFAAWGAPPPGLMDGATSSVGPSSEEIVNQWLDGAADWRVFHAERFGAELLRRLNRLRNDAGLRLLVADPRAHLVCSDHALEMALMGELSPLSQSQPPLDPQARLELASVKVKEVVELRAAQPLRWEMRHLLTWRQVILEVEHQLAAQPGGEALMEKRFKSIGVGVALGSPVEPSDPVQVVVAVVVFK